MTVDFSSRCRSRLRLTRVITRTGERVARDDSRVRSKLPGAEIVPVRAERGTEATARPVEPVHNLLN